MSFPTPEQALAQAEAMVCDLGIDPALVTSYEYGRLAANLLLLKLTAAPDHTQEQWEALIANLLYPDHKPYPTELYPDSAPSKHYQLALDAIDAIYNRLGE